MHINLSKSPNSPSSSGRARGGFRPGSRSAPRSGGYAPRGFSPNRFSSNRFAPRGGRRNGPSGEHIDPRKFINKIVVTEQVENFIPEHNFTDFSIDERLKQSILKKGYTVPTPIQDRCISHILKGVDMVGIANTGTGKTAAFLIPLINKVILNSK